MGWQRQCTYVYSKGHRIEKCKNVWVADPAPATNTQVQQLQQQAAAQAAAQQKILAEQEAAKIAAEKERQRVAALGAENASAYDKMQASFGRAKSVLPTLTSDVLSRDLARLQDVKAQYMSAGSSATGGGADLGAIRQQALANIGAGGMAGAGVAGPSSTNSPGGSNKFDKSAAAANLMVGGKDAPANRFNLPNISGLSFGGS